MFVAAVTQLNCTSDVEANWKSAEALIRRAAGRGAQLVATPENANYLGPHDRKVRCAEPLGGATIGRFAHLADTLNIHLLVGSFNERSEDPHRCYNTSVLLGPTGKTLAFYRKIHLFDVDVSPEVRFLESDTVVGGSDPKIAETSLGTIGMSICYDLRFPELYRKLVDRGATLLTVPSAFTATTGKDHWEVLLRARAEIEARFVRRDGGCTFCTFRYQPLRRLPPRGAAELLDAQLVALRDLGARGFSLQTEHPLAYLDHVLSRGAELGFEEVHVRTIPWLVLRHEGALRRAAAAGVGRQLGARGGAAGAADAHGVELVLGQVGFEAFDDLGLRVFHKGISPADNRAAARLLGELTDAHPRFEGTRGHGFIALHPWTRPADLRTNLEACRADAPWLLADLDPRRRLELYNEWSPLFWKARDDGLLEPSRDRFGWTFRFADDATGEIVAVASSLARGRDEPGWRVLDAVLAAYETHPDPAERKRAYLEIREAPAGAFS